MVEARGDQRVEALGAGLLGLDKNDQLTRRSRDLSQSSLMPSLRFPISQGEAT